MSDKHTYTVVDTPKMLKESLCVAQSQIDQHESRMPRGAEHANRLQRLIDECDRKRPVGNDGKHGDRHTLECGCEDKPSGSPYNKNGDMVTEAGQVFRQVGWQINGGTWNGRFIPMENDPNGFAEKYGGFSPVYVEVGSD